MVDDRAGAGELRAGELRAAALEDAPLVARIWHQGWRDGHLGFVPDQLLEARTAESFVERALDRVCNTTVVIVDGVVAGFVMVVDDEVEQVYVDADQRGAGVADTLMAAAERQVRVNGHQTGWLAVVSGNSRARRFYERRGWVDEGPFDYTAHGPAGPIPVPSQRYTKLIFASPCC